MLHRSKVGIKTQDEVVVGGRKPLNGVSNGLKGTELSLESKYLGGDIHTTFPFMGIGLP